MSELGETGSRAHIYKTVNVGIKEKSYNTEVFGNFFGELR